MKNRRMLMALACSLVFAACAGENSTNGVDGVNGVDGTNTSTQTTVLAEGDKNCPNGGIKIDVLSDGIIQEDQTQYICHDSTGAQGETGPQGGQGETGAADADDVCANNIKPEIELTITPSDGNQLIYEGKVYSLTVSANKAGLDYQFVAPLMEIAVAEAEIEKDGKYVTEYAVTTEEGAKSGMIIATDGCQTAESEWNMGAVVGPVEIFGIKIPAGSFNSSVSDAVNPVSVDAFVMAKTETTVEQFKACVDAGACTAENYRTPSTNLFCNYNRGESWLNHPMNCVNWYGANEYCAWIGGRLPTEDEWQYAATHNGTQALETTYPWGNDEPTHCVHATYNDYVSGSHHNACDGTTVIPHNNYVGTAPVGTYSAGNSPLGLQDMAGNVWELTSSVWHAVSIYYVIKGGSWDNYASGLPVSYRSNLSPGKTNDVVGFRCVADVE